MVLAKQKNLMGPLRSRSFPLTTVEDPPSQKYQRYGFCPVSASQNGRSDRHERYIGSYHPL
jgi:hypothetical protein